MSQHEEHLRLLSIFHYVIAGIVGLFAFLPILHVAIGLGMIFAPGEFEHSGPMDSALFGWIFVIGGFIAILLGLTMSILLFVAGRSLARRRRLLFCTVIAALECAFMPLGTLLGVFTLVNLTKPEVKELFNAG